MLSGSALREDRAETSWNTDCRSLSDIAKNLNGVTSALKFKVHAANFLGFLFERCSRYVTSGVKQRQMKMMLRSVGLQPNVS